jgi:hypothetical protein
MATVNNPNTTDNKILDIAKCREADYKEDKQRDREHAELHKEVFDKKPTK